MMINIPDIFPEDSPLDPDSYCIMTCTMHCDQAWKRKVHRCINEWRNGDSCPINSSDGVSLQTVSRRIDDLVDKGLLQQQSIFSDELGQQVDVYTPTDEGEAILEETKQEIVDNLTREVIIQAMQPGREDDVLIKDGVFDRLGDDPFPSKVNDIPSLRDHAWELLKATDKEIDIRVEA